VGAPESDGSHTFQYKGEQHTNTNRLISSISNRVPMDEQLKKPSRLVPHGDAVVFALINAFPEDRTRPWRSPLTGEIEAPNPPTHPPTR
jgi:hypothetical protein